jgi:hypothetical protein
VIISDHFTWTHEDVMVGIPEARRDFTFSTEQVFVLHVPRLNEYTSGRLYELNYSTSRLLQFSDDDVNALYPSVSDWRRLFLWTPQVTSRVRYTTKLSHPDGQLDSLSGRLPVIRLPEMYLVSAEAAIATDLAKSRERINELRRRRECDILVPDNVTDPELLRSEILLEYRREFIAEGILFYYYKRLDASRVEGLAGDFDKVRYLLPRPIEEIEFGNRQ